MWAICRDFSPPRPLDWPLPLPPPLPPLLPPASPELAHPPPMLQGSMVPTLQQMAVGTLIRFKHCLSDVGAVPLDLLHDVLAMCTAEELQDIEDGTREGSGRELSPWLWPYWWALLLTRGGPPTPGEHVPALPAAAEVAAGPPGVPPADYRQGLSQSLA